MGWNMSNILVNEAIAIKKAGSGGGSDPGLADRVTALETTVGDSSSGLVKDVDDLETTVGDSSSGLVKDVDDLETTVGDSSAGLVKSVSDLETTVGDSSSGLVKEVGDLAESIVTTLSGLSDTNITTPSDGQVLTYDGPSSKWVNAAGGSGGGEIYPLVETKIGKWGNDDLYRVVVDSTNTGSTITVDLSAYVSSLSNLRSLHGYATYTATVDYMVPLPYVSGSGNNTKSIMLFAIINDDKVVLRINNSLGTFTDPHYYIAIDYVKPVTP